MRNSTVKSILIHTAEDMEDTESAHLDYNLDIMAAEQDGFPIILHTVKDLILLRGGVK
jgi:hypothetical protein